MKRDRRKPIRIAVHLALLAVFIAPSFIVPSVAQAQSTPNPSSGQSTGSSTTAPADASTKKSQKASSAKSEPSAKITQAQIDAAKASGQVWVNTDTGVYHKGGRWYGKTKQGKFMDEKDAKKAGYKEAEKE
jgi:cytoskeletal protein RodZ